MNAFTQALKDIAHMDAMDRDRVEVPEWDDFCLPMDEAPKDGTIILVKNQCMPHPIRAAWTEYCSQWGNSMQWVSPTSGNMICPETWMPQKVSHKPPKD